MKKGKNYEICNTQEHLTEAFAGFAKFADFADFANSSSLQMPQLPHLPQSPHWGICLHQTFFFLRQAYSWSIPTPYQLRTISVPSPYQLRETGLGGVFLIPRLCPHTHCFYGAKVQYGVLLSQHPFPRWLQLHFLSSFVFQFHDNVIHNI